MAAKKSKTVKKKSAKKPAPRPAGKKAKRRVARKPAPRPAAGPAAAKGPKPIGRVTHFYAQIKVAIVRFNRPVAIGTELHFRGAHTDFKDKATSMQYDHLAIQTAPKGKEVGVKVKKRVREGDQIYLV